jgi:hypothetical protein
LKTYGAFLPAFVLAARAPGRAVVGTAITATTSFLSTTGATYAITGLLALHELLKGSSHEHQLLVVSTTITPAVVLLERHETGTETRGTGGGGLRPPMLMIFLRTQGMASPYFGDFS